MYSTVRGKLPIYCRYLSLRLLSSENLPSMVIRAPSEIIFILQGITSSRDSVTVPHDGATARDHSIQPGIATVPPKRAGDTVEPKQ
jgi:hypothetical protein